MAELQCTLSHFLWEVKVLDLTLVKSKLPVWNCRPNLNRFQTKPIQFYVYVIQNRHGFSMHWFITLKWHILVSRDLLYSHASVLQTQQVSECWQRMWFHATSKRMSSKLLAISTFDVDSISLTSLSCTKHILEPKLLCTKKHTKTRCLVLSVITMLQIYNSRAQSISCYG